MEKKENRFSKTPTVDLVKDVTLLEKKINLEIMKYNLMIAELIKRYPMLEGSKEFEFKELTKEESGGFKLI